MTETNRKVLWTPNPGPQTDFLASTANEVLYGGAAGGGKSAASIALPLRWVTNPNFRALFLRREAKYLGDAIDKSRKVYPHFGARLVLSGSSGGGRWKWPSGAELWLNHCEHEHDVANYDSYEFHLIIFEELTHFTEKQYRQIRARIRGTDPTLPRYSRASTNPGGVGHDWVYERFGAWLNPEHKNPARPGEKRWYRGDDEVPRGTAGSLSRQFIPAKLTDNPHVTAEYEAQLLDLDPVRRAQLRDGDWRIKPGKGLYFDRTKVRIVTELPPETDVIRRVRAWDLGATDDGDFSVGVRMASLRTGRYIVEDVIRFQGSPDVVDAGMLATAQADGTGIRVRIPQDPGQAGVYQVRDIVRRLAGFSVKSERPTGDKVTRAGPAAAQWMHGNFDVLLAPWTSPYLATMHGFPEYENDDDVDATADAFNELTSRVGGARPKGVGTNDRR